MANLPKRVIVLGSGVVGALSAYYLAESGVQVTVIDKGPFGGACSHGNCGYVSPSHVLPLATPGAVVSTLAAMIKPNSPFKIRPRLDLAFWSWMIGFAKRCNRKQMMIGAAAIQPMLSLSKRLYQELIDRESIACEWRTDGLLFVFQTTKAFDHFAETDRLLRSSFQTPAERIDAESLARLEPALKPGLAGAYKYECDAHFRPDRFMVEIADRLRRRNVDIFCETECAGFERLGSRAIGVKTSRGTFDADAFVLATGAWSARFGRELGCRLPVEPGKGYSITTPRPKLCPNLPMIFEEHRVAITPFDSGYRIGSTMEFAGFDANLNRKRLGLLRSGAELYLREPYAEPVLEEWFGWRPMTPDSVPIIDRSPALTNVVMAVGHNMLGISMGAATGAAVADLLLERPGELDLKPYRVDRF